MCQLLPGPNIVNVPTAVGARLVWATATRLSPYWLLGAAALLGLAGLV
jgi:chromate transport protein ChrA